jgi:hypothetical protein
MVEWHPVNLPISEFVYTPPHSLVGWELQMADGSIVLVGDVNELGGVCDDCPYKGNRDMIVVAVRQVVVREKG